MKMKLLFRRHERYNISCFVGLQKNPGNRTVWESVINSWIMKALENKRDDRLR
jgi:hypothetical protein